MHVPPWKKQNALKKSYIQHKHRLLKEIPFQRQFYIANFLGTFNLWFYLYNLGYPYLEMFGIEKLTNSNSVLKVCLSTLHTSSKYNFCIAEIAIKPFQHSFSKIIQNINKSMEHNKEICNSTYCIIELSRDQTWIFSLVLPRRNDLPSFKKFAILLPRIFLPVLWKSRN